MSSSSVLVLEAAQSDDDLLIGPTAQYKWGYKERAALKVDRGPWKFENGILGLSSPVF